jgi:hypothetical protein
MAESTIARSNSVTSRRNRKASSSGLKPITRSTPARASTAALTPSHPFQARRHRSRSSRASRRDRGSSRVVQARRMPPLSILRGKRDMDGRSRAVPCFRRSPSTDTLLLLCATGGRGAMRCRHSNRPASHTCMQHRLGTGMGPDKSYTTSMSATGIHRGRRGVRPLARRRRGPGADDSDAPTSGIRVHPCETCRVVEPRALTVVGSSLEDTLSNART